MSSHSKLKYILWFILLVIVFVVLYSFKQKPVEVVKPLYDLRSFKGNIVQVDVDKVTLKGVFIGKSGIPEEFTKPRNFTFYIGTSTTFKKDEVMWPSWDDLRAQSTSTKDAVSGTVDISKLPHVTGSVSLSEFKKSVSSSMNPTNITIEVTFAESVYGNTSPLAQHVFYKQLVMPTQ